ncbi:MAG: radical SAM protein [Candidatus Omnitrophica bacterium]|nr:radical SAM protein [Candidatus Omnitrophota bacterium]
MIYLINSFITSAERYGRNIGDIGGHQMPLGIYYLAAYLLRKGEEVKVIDGEALNLEHKDLVQILKKSDVKIVGLTSATVSFHRVCSLAQMIRREFPDVKIVIGGPHMSAMPEATMLTGIFDYGIVHEGEIAFSKLVKFLLHDKGEMKDISNLYYLDKGVLLHNPPGEYIQDLDALPFPARQLCPDLSIYKPPIGAFQKELVMNMFTSRGCPYRCIFCDNNTFGRKPRFFSAEYVVREIKELIYKFGIKEIAFLDDTFVLNRERLYRIFEILKEDNISFPWTCMTRVDNLDFNILRFMADNGCWQIKFGIESGNQKVLDFIKKGITLQQVRNVTDWCKRLRMKMTGFFMIGHHIDTPEIIQETIDFALSLPLTDIVVTLNTPMPGTESYEKAKLYGDYHKEDLSSFNYWTPIFVPKGLTSKLMLRKQSELYNRFYRQPRVILQHLERIRSWKEVRMYIYNILLGVRFIWRKKWLDNSITVPRRSIS